MGERIDPQIEEPVRRLLNHALHVEADEVESIVHRLAENGFLAKALLLACRISAVVVVDLSDDDGPTTERLDVIAAETAAMMVDKYDFDEETVRGFLTRVLFGDEAIDAVMAPEDASWFPFVITAYLVASSADVDNGEGWVDYLDAIENALEAKGEE